MVASHVPPSRELIHNPGMCHDWELNQQPFGSQARTQSTGLHQPGPKAFLNANNEISEMEITGEIPSTIAMRKIKYLGIN